MAFSKLLSKPDLLVVINFILKIFSILKLFKGSLKNKLSNFFKHMWLSYNKSIELSMSHVLRPIDRNANR